MNVKLSEADVAYLLLGLDQLFPGSEMASVHLQALKAKLLLTQEALHCEDGADV